MTNENTSRPKRTSNFGAFIDTPTEDSGGAAKDAGATPRTGRSRGRSTSRRSSKASGTSSADSGSDSQEGTATAEGEERRSRPRRRGTRGGRGRRKSGAAARDGAAEGDAVKSDAVKGDATQEVGAKGQIQGVKASSSEENSDEGQKAPRKKRTSRKRSPSHRRKASASRSDAGESAETKASSDENAASLADGPASEATKKQGRRGKRGGKKRTKRASTRSTGRSERPTAAVVEGIPGELDDLPELPELPDDAELLSDGGTQTRGRGRRASSDAAEAKPARRTKAKKEIVPDRQILVNAADREETRVAVVRNKVILDFQMNVEREQSLVNDIYRGRVVNLEASIGAAFIDFGRGRNGFLHTSDVLPAYGEKGWDITKLLSTRIDADEWDSASSQPDIADELDGKDDGDSDNKQGSRKGRGSGGGAQRRRARPRKPIKDLLRVGDRVIVQVTKDAIGDKGPTLTTYISIPGRYHVLMPSTDHRGVSRKIEDVRERKRLKKILDALEVPEGMGVIARTAAKGCNSVELKRDLVYLLDAWNRLSNRVSRGNGPAALYEESDVAIRTVRDLFSPETESVVVDDEQTYKRVKEFAELLMPEHVDCIKLHKGERPLFHDAGIEQDFERIFSRSIELPSGGSIVFDQAEALVAIDVNSGKTRTKSHDFEEIALKTNLDAVPEIARQIRLRDLGGILVVDFIDMMNRTNRGKVEKAFRDQLAQDRARHKLGKISQFGLLEMTRQRLGPGMSTKLFNNCTACRGLGRVRTAVSRAAGILRRLGSSMTLKGFSTIEVRAHQDALDYLKQAHKSELDDLEKKHSRSIKLVAAPEQFEDSVLRYLRSDGSEVRPGGRRKR
jgi:ribonuclease E